jgi:hypothetical protein
MYIKNIGYKEFNQALENKGPILCAFNVESNPLSHMDNKQIILKPMPPKVYDFGGK